MNVNTTGRHTSAKKPDSTKTSLHESMSSTGHLLASENQELPSYTELQIPEPLQTQQKSASFKDVHSTLKETSSYTIPK